MISTAGRLIRKYNFSRLMNLVGFPQIGEFGVAVNTLGFKATLKHLPTLRRLLKEARKGTLILDDPILRDAEILFGGIGSQKIFQSVMNQSDDIGSAMSNRLSNTERVFDYANRGTAIGSQMFMINTIMQRIVVKEFLVQLAEEAHGGKKIFTKNRFGIQTGAKADDRLGDLGISPEMKEKIFKQFISKSKLEDGHFTKIQNPNLNKWDDMDALSSLVIATRRFARRVIQENDIGETAYMGRKAMLNARGLQDSPLGKILFQFRTFMMTAYGKHFIHGLKFRDYQTFEGFMTQSLFASIGYILRTMTVSAAMGSREREEYLEKKLSVKAISRASFQNSAYASLLPGAFDSTVGLFMEEPLFHYRSSGLDTNFITGNPTFSLFYQKIRPTLNEVGKAINPTVDDGYTESDFNKLKGALMFSNYPPITGMLNIVGSTLPEDK